MHYAALPNSIGTGRFEVGRHNNYESMTLWGGDPAYIGVSGPRLHRGSPALYFFKHFSNILFWKLQILSKISLVL